MNQPTFNYQEDKKKAIEAKLEAQKIAFAPIVFQAAKVLRDTGILQVVLESKDEGLTIEEITSKVKVPLYGVKVLVESGLGAGLFLLNDNKYTLTKTGYFILADHLTKANMDFVHDVCYLGMFKLDEAIAEGKPAGLKVFGEWNTLYEALSTLPPKVQESWFGFDHYYSDQVFEEILPLVFENNRTKIMDIGANTGRFTIKALSYSKDAQLTTLDLQNQLNMAKKNIVEAGFNDRVVYHPINILDTTQEFPKGQDVIWMSQFLDCFSKAEIVTILERAKRALNPNGKVFILETYWDRQRFEASAFSLQQTSLYFTCIANGNSQMYAANDMEECLDKAGFTLEKDINGLGVSHTLFICTSK